MPVFLLALSCAVKGQSSRNCIRLQRAFAPLSGPYPQGLLHGRDEDLAVAHGAGPGRMLEGPHHPGDQLVRHHQLDFHFRHQVHLILGAAIHLGVSLLAAHSLHLAEGEAGHPGIDQSFLHRVDLEGLDDGLDLFHVPTALAVMTLLGRGDPRRAGGAPLLRSCRSRFATEVPPAVRSVAARRSAREPCLDQRLQGSRGAGQKRRVARSKRHSCRDPSSACKGTYGSKPRHPNGPETRSPRVQFSSDKSGGEGGRRDNTVAAQSPAREAGEPSPVPAAWRCSPKVRGANSSPCAIWRWLRTTTGPSPSRGGYAPRP